MPPETTDPFGTIFITDGRDQKYDSYYSTLDRLHPFFTSQEWKAQNTGFYVNCIGPEFAVRISYFCSSGRDPRQTVEAFAKKLGLSQVGTAESPALKEVAAAYGREEARFRRYLTTYTQIGLDLLETDRFYAQCLLATFRFQVFPLKGSYEAHFATSFEHRSSSYRTMPSSEKSQFWADLANWPNPGKEVDWAHMFVNMIMVLDCNNHLTTLQKLSISEINDLLHRKGHIFQVPTDWSPDGS